MIQPNDKRTKIQWTPYLACAYAEGFCEGGDATPEQQIEAWSFIAINELWQGLQGFYGRTVNTLKEQEILNLDGTINWDNFDNKFDLI